MTDTKKNHDLDIRHMSIIDALPVFNTTKEILTVGCGSAKLEVALQEIGYTVFATDSCFDDYGNNKRKENLEKINFTASDIFDLSTFPVDKSETVICSEVLEHIVDWRKAFKNLLQLTGRRLIITVPYYESFNVEGDPPDGHCNFWTDLGNDPYAATGHASKNVITPITQFASLAYPYHVSVTKICTKYSDWLNSSRCYLLIIDKNQLAEFCLTKSDINTYFEIQIDENGHRRIEYQSLKDQATAFIPPLPIGPPLPYHSTTSLYDIVVFAPRDILMNSKHKKMLAEAEYLTTSLGIRLWSLSPTQADIDKICKNLPGSNQFTGVPIIGLVNMFSAAPHEFVKALNIKNKFLIDPSPASDTDFKVYNDHFKNHEMSVWENILGRLTG